MRAAATGGGRVAWGRGPGDPAASRGFVSTIAGTLAVPEFFSEANITQIMTATGD